MSLVSGFRKPNQAIRPSPLYLLPAVCEPFEHVLVDCVSPLPQTKFGLSKVMQADQGSDFYVKGVYTSFEEAWNPASESQRALEWFHQTLKNYAGHILPGVQK